VLTPEVLQKVQAMLDDERSIPEIAKELNLRQIPCEKQSHLESCISHKKTSVVEAIHVNNKK